MNETFVDAQDLAERWGVSRQTALAYTRYRGFPSPLALSGRTLRWTLDEVVEWEKARKAQPVRRTTPKRGLTASVQPIVRVVGAR